VNATALHPRVAIKRARKWAIWEVNPSTKVYISCVHALALIGAIWAIATSSIAGKNLVDFVVLATLGLAFEECTRHIERMRTKIRVERHEDMNAVWTFAAALVLPPVLTLLLVVVIQFHAWHRHLKVVAKPYRAVFTTSTIWLACLAVIVTARAVGVDSLGSGVRDFGIVVVGGAAYAVTNIGLVYLAICMASRPGPRPPVGTMWQGSLQHIATLGLGGLAALALTFNPWLITLVLPAMVMVQRIALFKQLEIAATTDPKTGLLNATAWHQLANATIERSRRESDSCALLIVDMDNFKMINDTYGHLAGDAVLKSVADVLTTELRLYDSVGRFGGEEFVAMLPKVDALAALSISDRVLDAIRRMEVVVTGPGETTIKGLTASIGLACYPQQGTEVEELLHIADSSLYTAKREGRDRVEYSYIAP
jgi:diguanylate cyclase (GGDEF)-like protein